MIELKTDPNADFYIGFPAKALANDALAAHAYAKALHDAQRNGTFSHAIEATNFIEERAASYHARLMKGEAL